MKTSVIPISSLTPEQAADWIALTESAVDADKTAAEVSSISGMDNPFLRPEYAAFAGRVLPNIEVAVLSENGTNVGFFPFERQTDGSGLPIGRFLSDLHAFVVAEDVAWNADDLIRACGLKAWRFDHLLANQTPFAEHHSYVDESYLMDLRNGYEAYCEQRRTAGSSAVKQAARKKRKLEREIGPVRFTAHTTEQSAWETLARWKSEQLIRLGYADMFRLDWVNALIEELRTFDDTDFGPLLSTLHAGDEMIAVHLGLRSPTVVSSWIPTFSAQHSKYSPGLILHLELAEWAAARGMTRVDLCRGENQMKLSLASGWFDVAVGSADHRILHRTMTRAYYGLRNMVHASPFKDLSLRAVRRIKTWIA